MELKVVTNIKYSKKTYNKPIFKYHIFEIYVMTFISAHKLIPVKSYVCRSSLLTRTSKGGLEI